MRVAKILLARNLLASCTPLFVAALVLGILSLSCRFLPGGASGAATGECIIEGPLHLAPRQLAQLELGLAKSSVDRIMGPPAQSPAPQEFYYFTGGLCPFGNPARELFAPCGLAAVFSHQEADGPSQVAESATLQRCWWGAIVTGFARENSVQ